MHTHLCPLGNCRLGHLLIRSGKHHMDLRKAATMPGLDPGLSYLADCGTFASSQLRSKPHCCHVWLFALLLVTQLGRCTREVQKNDRANPTCQLQNMFLLVARLQTQPAQYELNVTAAALHVKQDKHILALRSSPAKCCNIVRAVSVQCRWDP